MRHVGWTLFARALCRKFAAEATISWHLPQCRIGNRDSGSDMRVLKCDVQEALPSFRGLDPE